MIRCLENARKMLAIWGQLRVVICWYWSVLCCVTPTPWSQHMTATLRDTSAWQFVTSWHTFPRHHKSVMKVQFSVLPPSTRHQGRLSNTNICKHRIQTFHDRSYFDAAGRIQQIHFDILHSRVYLSELSWSWLWASFVINISCMSEEEWIREIIEIRLKIKRGASGTKYRSKQFSWMYIRWSLMSVLLLKNQRA